MTNYSLDLDRSQIFLPSSQMFEVCQIIEEDPILLITLLVSDCLPRRLVRTAKTSPRLESRVKKFTNTSGIFCKRQPLKFKEKQIFFFSSKQHK